MCFSEREFCPACLEPTGRTYMFPVVHGIGELCVDNEEAVYVPRSALGRFECPNVECTLGRASTRENEAKIASARERLAAGGVAAAGGGGFGGSVGGSVGGRNSSIASERDNIHDFGRGPSPRPLGFMPINAPGDVGNRPQKFGPRVSTGQIRLSAYDGDGFDDDDAGSSAPARAPKRRFDEVEPLQTAGSQRRAARGSDFFRAKHAINKANLSPDVQGKIAELMAVIDANKTPAAVAINAGDLVKSSAPDLWLPAEDELVQLLRLHRFPYKQMSEEFLIHRTRGAIEHRRLKQRQGSIGSGFVYIPDTEAVPEAPRGSAFSIPTATIITPATEQSAVTTRVSGSGAGAVTGDSVIAPYAGDENAEPSGSRPEDFDEE